MTGLFVTIEVMCIVVWDSSILDRIHIYCLGVENFPCVLVVNLVRWVIRGKHTGLLLANIFCRVTRSIAEVTGLVHINPKSIYWNKLQETFDLHVRCVLSLK